MGTRSRMVLPTGFDLYKLDRTQNTSYTDCENAVITGPISASMKAAFNDGTSAASQQLNVHPGTCTGAGYTDLHASGRPQQSQPLGGGVTFIVDQADIYQ